ncbi:MAG TPA: radical SAM family heme chaperone HemW [Flavipsychrobacter sp.]|nr:radical SAM family heme chaperone HemW [Flavipsychrobacter sp.]
MAGIYIHIPFCKQKCTYCNFHFSTSLSQKEALLEALHTELIQQKEYLQGATIDTIYFGGGTPSLLSADEINRLMDTLLADYSCNSLQEFTLEANPDDLKPAYLKSLKATPVSRLSIGIQSFQDDDLKFMNRSHNAQEADYAIKVAQDTGFTNLTIDLIYGSPFLSDVDWQANLQRVQVLQIPHFSAYALTVEEGTLLHHNIRKKLTEPLDQEKAAAQFEILIDQASQLHYEHYEISNLALKDHYAIHNTNYWRGHHYLGIGPSAHSFNGASRRWNIANNSTYIKSMMGLHPAAHQEEQLTIANQVNEYVMTTLRTQWGCDLNTLGIKYGKGFKEMIVTAAQSFIQQEYLLLQGQTLLLTKKGKLIADRIAGELFVEG